MANDNKHQRVPLKESKMGGIVLLIIFFSLMFSAIPEWSTLFWIANWILAFVMFVIIFIAWFDAQNSKRYFSILSYCMLLAISVYTAQPVLRTLWDANNNTWIYLGGVWLIVFIFTHFIKERIFRMFSDPFGTKGGIIYHSIFLLFVLIIPIILTISRYNGENTKFLMMCMILYLISLFAVFILPAFLKKPEEVEAEIEYKISDIQK